MFCTNPAKPLMQPLSLLSIYDEYAILACSRGPNILGAKHSKGPNILGAKHPEGPNIPGVKHPEGPNIPEAKHPLGPNILGTKAPLGLNVGGQTSRRLKFLGPNVCQPLYSFIR